MQQATLHSAHRLIIYKRYRIYSVACSRRGCDSDCMQTHVITSNTPSSDGVSYLHHVVSWVRVLARDDADAAARDVFERLLGPVAEVIVRETVKRGTESG